jgi:hypothetical protein
VRSGKAIWVRPDLSFDRCRYRDGIGGAFDHLGSVAIRGVELIRIITIAIAGSTPGWHERYIGQCR